MFIKEVLNYDYSYAEYIVSDNKNDVVCMCLSVPLPNGKKPMPNMEIKMIYAFSVKGIKIKQIKNDKDRNVKIQHDDYFKYNLIAKVLDRNKSLVCIDNLKISLKNDYEGGFPINILDGDYIQFRVDRLDCELK